MNNFEYESACKHFLENIIYNNYGIIDNELLTNEVIIEFEDNISNFLNKNILFEETSINDDSFYEIFNYIDKNLTKLTKYKSLHIFLNFKTGAIETIYKDKIYTISIQKTLNYYNFTLKRGKYIVTSIKKSKSINDLTKVLDYLIQLD